MDTRGVHALGSLVNGALASAPGETHDARHCGSRVEDERSQGRRQCQDWDDDHHGSLAKAPATMRADSRRHRAVAAHAARCRLHLHLPFLAAEAPVVGQGSTSSFQKRKKKSDRTIIRLESCGKVGHHTTSCVYRARKRWKWPF